MFEAVVQWGGQGGVAFVRSALPLIVLAVTALVVGGIELVRPSRRAHIAVLSAGLGVSFFLSWQMWASASGASQGMFLIDRVTIVGWQIAIIATAFALLVSCSDRGEGVERSVPAAMLGVIAFGMALLVAAADLVVILIAFEIIAAGAVALIVGGRAGGRAHEAAVKFFIPSLLATAFMAMGAACLFGVTGATELGAIAERIPECMASPMRSLVLVGVGLVTVAFALRIAIAAFHAWMPDAIEGAPPAAAVILTTGAMAAGLIAFMRVALAVAAIGPLWRGLLTALAVASIVVGNLGALAQTNLKRMLGFAAIAQVGLALIVLPSVAADPSGVSRALILFLLVTVVLMAAAFAAVSAIGGAGSVDSAQLAGLASRRPVLAATFSLILLALAGLPPTVGFVARYDLFLTALGGGDVGLVLVGAFGSVLSIAYFLKPVWTMVFCEPHASMGAFDEDATVRAIPAPLVAVLAIAAMVVILFGILPQNLVAYLSLSAW